MHNCPDLPIETFLPAIYDIEDGGSIYPENMPNMKFARTCYMLPNLLAELRQCCFNTVNLSACIRTNNPMVHVISKAWPVRCSIRNFSDIVSNYITKEAYVKECLTDMLYCTFSGRYPHCAPVSEQLKFKCEHVLYRYFVHIRPDSSALSAWIRNNHQHIVFVCIKEYIVFLVDTVPGLKHSLQAMHPWKDFVSSVREQADFMRCRFRKNISDHVPAFAGIQLGITSMKSFRCKLNTTGTRPMNELFDAKSMPIPECHRCVYNAPLRIAMYRIIKAKGVRCTHLASKLLEMDRLEQGSFDYKFAMRELTHAVNFASSEAYVHLPRHICEAQNRNRAKNMRQSSVYVCLCCKQVRSFLVSDTTASKNAWARGNSKVLIDDCTGELYCGKKIEKNTSVTRQHASTGKAHRMYWKMQGNLTCKHSKLIEVPLLGRIYTLFGVSYMLCPSCLCVMHYTQSRMQGDTIVCIHCQYMSRKNEMSGLCFHCYNKCEQGFNFDIRGTSHTVCKSCMRPWMEMPSVTQKISVELAHRAINERWKTNRINGELQDLA